MRKNIFALTCHTQILAVRASLQQSCQRTLITHPPTLSQEDLRHRLPTKTQRILGKRVCAVYGIRPTYSCCFTGQARASRSVRHTSLGTAPTTSHPSFYKAGSSLKVNSPGFKEKDSANLEQSLKIQG